MSLCGLCFWKECHAEAEISTGTADFSSKWMALFPSTEGSVVWTAQAETDGRWKSCYWQLG